MISISCLETKLLNNNNWYGRFQLAPFRKGEGLTVANALRRTLLAEKSNFYISWVDFYNAEIPYSVLTGMRESIFDILLNLKQVIFTSNIIMPSKKKKNLRLDVLDIKSSFSDSQVLSFKSKSQPTKPKKMFSIIYGRKHFLNSTEYKKHWLKPIISRGYSWYKPPRVLNSNESKFNSINSKDFILNRGKAMGPIDFDNKYNEIELEKKNQFAPYDLFQSNTNQLNEVPEFIKNSDHYQIDDSMDAINSKAKHSLPYIGYICVKGPAIIYAKHIKLPKGLKCVDPDKYIVTLADDGLFYLRFAVIVKKNHGSSLLKDDTNTNNDFTNLSQTNANASGFSLNSSNTWEAKFLPRFTYNMCYSSVKKYYESLSKISKQKLQYAKTSCYPQKAAHILMQLPNKIYNLNDNWYPKKLKMLKLPIRNDIKNIQCFAPPKKFKIPIPYIKDTTNQLKWNKRDSYQELSQNNIKDLTNYFLSLCTTPDLEKQRYNHSNNSCKLIHSQNVSILANLKKTCLLNIKIKHYYYKCGRFDRFLFDFIKSFKPSFKSNYKMSQLTDELFFDKYTLWNLNISPSLISKNKRKMIRFKYAKQNIQKKCFSYFERLKIEMNFSNHLLESDYGYQLKKNPAAFQFNFDPNSSRDPKNFSKVFCPMHKKILKGGGLSVLYHKKTLFNNLVNQNENKELNNIWSFFYPNIKSQSISITLRNIFLRKISVYRNSLRYLTNNALTPENEISNFKLVETPFEHQISFTPTFRKQYNRSYFSNVYSNSSSAIEATKIKPILTNSVVLKPIYLNIEYILYILKQSTKYCKNQRLNWSFFDLTHHFKLKKINNADKKFLPYPKNKILESKINRKNLAKDIFNNSRKFFKQDSSVDGFLILGNHRIQKNWNFFTLPKIKSNVNSIKHARTQHCVTKWAENVFTSPSYLRTQISSLKLSKITKPISAFNKKRILKLTKSSDTIAAYSVLGRLNQNIVLNNTNNFVNLGNLFLNFKINHNRLQVEPFNINIYNSKIGYTLRYTYPFKYTIFETFLQFIFKRPSQNSTVYLPENKDDHKSIWLPSHMLKYKKQNFHGFKSHNQSPEAFKWDHILYNESFKIYTNLSSVRNLLPSTDNSSSQLFLEYTALRQKELATIIDNTSLKDSSIDLRQHLRSKGAYPAFITKSNFYFPVKFNRKVNHNYTPNSTKTLEEYIQLGKESLNNNWFEKYSFRGFPIHLQPNNFTEEQRNNNKPVGIPSCFTLERYNYFTLPKSYFMHNYIPAKIFVKTKDLLSILRVLPFTWSVWNLVSSQLNQNSSISNGFFQVDPIFKTFQEGGENFKPKYSGGSQKTFFEDQSQFAPPQSNNAWLVSNKNPICSLLVNATNNSLYQYKLTPALLSNGWNDKTRKSLYISKFANYSNTKVLSTLKEFYKWRITNIVKFNDAWITIPFKESFYQAMTTMFYKHGGHANLLDSYKNPTNSANKIIYTKNPLKIRRIEHQNQENNSFKRSLSEKFWLRPYFFRSGKTLKHLNIYVTMSLDKNSDNDYNNFLFSQKNLVSKINNHDYQTRWAINKAESSATKKTSKSLPFNFENIYYKNVLYNPKKITSRLLTNALFPLVVNRKFNNVTSITTTTPSQFSSFTPFLTRDVKQFPHYVTSFSNLYSSVGGQNYRIPTDYRINNVLNQTYKHSLSQRNFSNLQKQYFTGQKGTPFGHQKYPEFFAFLRTKTYLSASSSRFINIENNLSHSKTLTTNNSGNVSFNEENQPFFINSHIKKKEGKNSVLDVVNFYSFIPRNEIPPGNFIKSLRATVLKKVLPIKRNVTYTSGVFENFTLNSNVKHDFNFSNSNIQSLNKEQKMLSDNKELFKDTNLQSGNNFDHNVDYETKIDHSSFFNNYSSYVISMESDLFLQNLISRDLEKREFYQNSSPGNEENSINSNYSYAVTKNGNFQNAAAFNHFKSTSAEFTSRNLSKNFENSDEQSVLSSASRLKYSKSRSPETHNVSYLWRKTAHLEFLRTCSFIYNTKISSIIEVRQNWYNLRTARLGPYNYKNSETLYKLPVSLFSEFTKQGNLTDKSIYIALVKKPCGSSRILKIGMFSPFCLLEINKIAHGTRFVKNLAPIAENQMFFTSFIYFYPIFLENFDSSFRKFRGASLKIKNSILSKQFTRSCHIQKRSSFFAFFRHEQYPKNQILSFCGKKCWQHPIIQIDKIKILPNYDSSTYSIWSLFLTLITTDMQQLNFSNSAKSQLWFPTLSHTLLSSNSGKIYKDLLNLIDKEVYQKIYKIIDTNENCPEEFWYPKNQLSATNSSAVIPLRDFHESQFLDKHFRYSLKNKESHRMVNYFTIKENTLPGHFIHKVNYIVESHFIEYAAVSRELISFQQNQSQFKNSQENEYIQIDIWTNGELSPRKALLNAFKKLFELFYNLSKYNFLKPIEI